MIIGGVAGWYHNELRTSTELIDSFVKDVERQAAESVARYEREKQTHVLELSGEGEETYVKVETYRGLDNENWNLEKIAKEYFPSLQRRSAFLTVWGYFEHELDKLCSLYKSEKGFGLEFSDAETKRDRSLN
jgi:hypothetical protein